MSPTVRHPEHFAGFNLVHSYSRHQALADGALVDASTLAREAGIRIPVAQTAAAYQAAVAMTPAAERAGNDLVGRMWDVVWMLYVAIRRSPEVQSVLSFEVLVVRDKTEPDLIQLMAVCGPGDDAEPVITIMLPGES